MEQRLKSSDPPELQKRTLGPAWAGGGAGQHASASWHEGTQQPARATPRPMPSAETAKPTPNSYPFGNKTRARLVTKKVLRVNKCNVLTFYGMGIGKLSSGDSFLLKLGK